VVHSTTKTAILYCTVLVSDHPVEVEKMDILDLIRTGTAHM